MKKPRLFYYEEGVNAWCPVPDRVEEFISLDSFSDEEDRIELEFRMVMMTDEEFENLPEAD